MKSHLNSSQLLKTACLLMACHLSLVTTSHGQEASKPVMRDAVTHEQLNETLRKTGPQDPMKSFKPVSGEDPSVVNRPQDLISRSEILCYNGIVTLVPKRAVLQIPKNLSDRLKIQTGAKIKTWADFYTINRSWITTMEVSRAQAEGKIAFPEETRRQMVKNGNVIIATFQGNPISVLPLKIPEPSPTAANSKSLQP